MSVRAIKTVNDTAYAFLVKTGDFPRQLQDIFSIYTGTEPKQDRFCTYIVTLRRVRATTVAVEKRYVLHIVSACLYP